MTYQPGDVYVVEWKGATTIAYCSPGFWALPDGYADNFQIETGKLKILRKCAVIDPDDRDAVAGFTDRFYEHFVPNMPTDPHGYNAMQSALRRHVNSAPKSVEPTGAGAIVKDSTDNFWLLVDDDDLPWKCIKGERRGTWNTWDYLSVVEIIEHGKEI